MVYPKELEQSFGYFISTRWITLKSLLVSGDPTGQWILNFCACQIKPLFFCLFPLLDDLLKFLLFSSCGISVNSVHLTWSRSTLNVPLCIQWLSSTLRESLILEMSSMLLLSFFQDNNLIFLMSTGIRYTFTLLTWRLSSFLVSFVLMPIEPTVSLSRQFVYYGSFWFSLRMGSKNSVVCEFISMYGFSKVAGHSVVAYKHFQYVYELISSHICCCCILVRDAWIDGWSFIVW